MHEVATPTQTPSLPTLNEAVGTESQRITVPSAEEMLQSTAVQWLKGGNPTTGLPSGRLVIRPRELNITFTPQCKAKRTANLTKTCCKKTAIHFVFKIPI